ncbi:zinc-binding alcohol dehydrogenase family protein [Umbelopsis sp. AD052]|nr:zinc-binding alcohol dehydrogenase family protein [Umbelopsis sp. AD052]
MSNQAIVFAEAGPASVLKVGSIPRESPTGWDILVKNFAVSVNPVDTKVRSVNPGWSQSVRVLGYDAAGIVEEVGPKVTDLFKKGDHVWYAGLSTRNGSNSEFTLVDGRTVGKKPTSLDWTVAAAFPLVSLTAYELMIEKMAIQKGDPGNLLIVNAAGGVGSIALQLATKVLGIKNVVATASRSETIDWVKKLGATHVINHREPLGPQIEALGFPIKNVLLFFDPDAYIPQVIQFIQPFGKIGSILAPQKANFLTGHRKSITLYLESMFAKSEFGVNEASQGKILDEMADLVDAGHIQSIASEAYPYNVENLQNAHKKLEAGAVVGKIVLTVDENSFKQ